MRRREFIRDGLGALTVVGALPGWAKWDWKRPDRSAEEVDSSGLGYDELNAIMDRIEAENDGRPYVVTRTKCLRAIFEKARLAVKADDTFVDWMPDCWILTERRVKHVARFEKSRPEFQATGGTNICRGDTHGAYHACLDASHVCPDWESILSLGPKGLADRARKRRESAANDDERLFLDCVTEVYEAMVALCIRWAALAESRGAKACAAVLREIAVHPPRTLREALQLQLVYDRCQEAESECVRSQGLFDRLYLRFYRDDLAAGRETRASAKELIRQVFLKYWLQAHPNGKNIAFGGYGRDGRPVWNELTEVAFELHYELNHINPKLTFRYGTRTPHDQLVKVTRCLAAGRTAVVFFNDDTAREMFVRRGKDPADTADAVLIGCYEPGIQGREVIASMAAWINLAKPLEAAFNSGRAFDGFRLGPDCELPRNADEFEREYLRQLDAVAATACRMERVYAENWYELNPSPLMSGAFRDAVANARDAYRGAMKYNQSGIMCGGLATVADSIAAVRYLVDETKAVSMAELRDILMSDWKGREELRLKASRLPPKWGNNDDRVDLIAKRVYSTLAKRVNAEPNGHGGTFQAGFWSIDNDRILGKWTAATPDGRRKGSPISRNNVATAGCGKGGPTALILSNAKLDQAEGADGHIVDIILPAVAKESEADSAERIAAVLETFAATGGQCVHLNVFNSATLRDAQRHPEKYEDLQVRVCGWNVRWNDLSKVEQEHFIATAEAQE